MAEYLYNLQNFKAGKFRKLYQVIPNISQDI